MEAKLVIRLRQHDGGGLSRFTLALHKGQALDLPVDMNYACEKRLKMSHTIMEAFSR